MPDEPQGPHPQGETKRDFLFLATGAMGAAGTALALWPFIDSMNPTASVRSAGTVEIDLAPIEPGQRITVTWRGQPLFVVHRTEAEIARARADDDSPDLRDPATDASRVQRPEWLIMIGVCTHLGCIPQGQRPGDPHGPYGGWFCSCHGSVYDISGRVRGGPAPRNLVVPEYVFLDERQVRVG